MDDSSSAPLPDGVLAVTWNMVTPVSWACVNVSVLVATPVVSVKTVPVVERVPRSDEKVTGAPWRASPWEFVTKELKLDPEHIRVTVYEEDDEARALWREIAGLPD